MDKMNRTHKGLMFGIVPVYLDMTDEECPEVEARHLLFEPVLDICEAIFGCCVWIVTAFNPDFEPEYPIRITGELPRTNKNH